MDFILSKVLEKEISQLIHFGYTLMGSFCVRLFWDLVQCLKHGTNALHFVMSLCLYQFECRVQTELSGHFQTFLELPTAGQRLCNKHKV